MAIDSTNKRRSAHGVAPVPDSAISAPDRMQIAGFYRYGGFSGTTSSGFLCINLDDGQLVWVIRGPTV